MINQGIEFFNKLFKCRLAILPKALQAETIVEEIRRKSAGLLKAAPASNAIVIANEKEKRNFLFFITVK